MHTCRIQRRNLLIQMLLMIMYLIQVCEQISGADFREEPSSSVCSFNKECSQVLMVPDREAPISHDAWLKTPTTAARRKNTHFWGLSLDHAGKSSPLNGVYHMQWPNNAYMSSCYVFPDWIWNYGSPKKTEQEKELRERKRCERDSSKQIQIRLCCNYCGERTLTSTWSLNCGSWTLQSRVRTRIDGLSGFHFAKKNATQMIILSLTIKNSSNILGDVTNDVT